MSGPPTASFFKKGKTRPASTRQRSPPPPPPQGVAGDASEVVVPARKAHAGILTQRTKRRRQAAHDDLPPAADADADAEGAVDIRWTGGAASHVNAVRDILDDDAAAAAVLARKRPRVDEHAGDEDGDGDGDEDRARGDHGLYRGQAAYKSRIVRSKDVPKSMRVGPQRDAAAASTIRTATIMDYQPDVCKDYKETGFCGFGDTCKFLHDRGTYLAGWQLDKLASSAAAAAAVGDARDGGSSEDDEAIPFACLICRKTYTDPVVTRCGHYFCSRCAIKRYAKTPKCLACGVPTGGLFNRADKVIEKMRSSRGGDGEEDGEGGGAGGRKDVVVEGLAEASGSGSGEETDDG